MFCVQLEFMAKGGDPLPKTSLSWIYGWTSQVLTVGAEYHTKKTFMNMME